MNKVVCKLKDDILKSLYLLGFEDYEEFLEDFQRKGYQSHETELSIDELEKDGLVLRMMDKRQSFRKIIVLCAKGKTFLSNDSFLWRFEKREKEERDEKRRIKNERTWKLIKKILIILFAAASVYLAWQKFAV